MDNIRHSEAREDIPDSSQIEPFGPDSCLKPISKLGQIYNATPPGDLLLFMIALNRKEQKKNLTTPTPVQ
jgi:hypothetical protein